MHSVVIRVKSIVLFSWKFLTKYILNVFTQKIEMAVLWCDGGGNQHDGDNYIAICKCIKSIHCTPSTYTML